MNKTIISLSLSDSELEHAKWIQAQLPVSKTGKPSSMSNAIGYAISFTRVLYSEERVYALINIVPQGNQISTSNSTSKK
jgi:hypothetical protein